MAIRLEKNALAVGRKYRRNLSRIAGLVLTQRQFPLYGADQKQHVRAGFAAACSYKYARVGVASEMDELRGTSHNSIFVGVGRVFADVV